MSFKAKGFEDFAASLPKEMRDAYRQIGVRVLAQWQREFNDNSRGAGGWTPLTLRTALSRRSAAKGNKLAKAVKKGGTPEELDAFFAAKAAELERKTRVRIGAGKDLNAPTANTKRANAILVETGLLKASLKPGNPGNVFEDIVVSGKAGIRVGIGGPAKAAKKTAKGTAPSKITLGQLARIHNFGTKTIPARRILNPLNDQTKASMTAAQARAINRAAKKR